MVANLLRNFLTSGVRVQRWRQHVNIIDLRDDIFEFDVGTDERLIAGEITLRKDQDTRRCLPSLHSEHLRLDSEGLGSTKCETAYDAFQVETALVQRFAIVAVCAATDGQSRSCLETDVAGSGHSIPKVGSSKRTPQAVLGV